MRKTFQLLLLCSSMLLWFSCGSSSPAPASPGAAGPTVAGSVVKGAVTAATVTAYAVNADFTNGASLGSTTTDASGNFKLTLSQKVSGPVRLTATGGSYTSEYDASTISTGVNLSAFLDNGSSDANGVAITPLSELVNSLIPYAAAHPLPRADGGGGPHAGALGMIKGAYGLNGTTYIEHLTPSTSKTSITGDDNAKDGFKSGLVNGSLLSCANQGGVAPVDYITSLSIDIKDGRFDGLNNGVTITIGSTGKSLSPTAGTTDFLGCLNDYVQNGKSPQDSGIGSGDVETFVYEISNGMGGSSLVPVNVTLSPYTQSTIDQGQTVAFSVSIANDINSKGVTWQVSGTGCSGSGCGTITKTSFTQATYTAPSGVTADLAVTVTVTSAADTTKKASAPVVVKPAPQITTASPLPVGTVNLPYSVTLQDTGGVGNCTWSLAPQSSLPPGLTMNGWGVISGSPQSAGSFSFTVQATDAAATPMTAQKQFSITVAQISVTITNKFSTIQPGAAAVTLNATVQNDVSSQGVTWTLTAGSGNCSPDCGILSGASATSVTYTPPTTAPSAPSNAPTIIATSVADNTRSDFDSFTVSSGPPLAAMGYAYVTSLYSAGTTIWQYMIGLNGALTPLSAPVVTGHAEGIALDPSGRYAYVADDQLNAVWQYTIGNDGTLLGMTPATVATGKWPEAVAVDPSGSYVYVPNQSDGSVSQYTIGPTGALTPMVPASVASCGANRIAIHPSGKFAYVGGTCSNDIGQFGISSNGALLPLTPASVASGDRPEAIVVDPSGYYLYATNPSPHSISQYTIGADGTLTPMSPATVATGCQPLGMAIEPSGNYAYVMNNSGGCTPAVSSALSEYTIGTGGALSPMSTPTVATGTYPHFGAIDPTSLALYAPDWANANLWQYTIGADGSVAAMNPATVTTGLLPFAIATTRGPAAVSAWGFVDGGAGGINYQAGSADWPQLIVFNNKLYASWYEGGAVIRVAVYNGNDISPAWTFVDGDTSTGLTHGYAPAFAVFNGKLYLTYDDGSSGPRVFVYNGNDTAPVWTNVDGGQALAEGNSPQLAVFAGKLYMTFPNTAYAIYGPDGIRVAVYNGNDTSPAWTFVDNSSSTGTGIYYSVPTNVWTSHLAAFNGKLYLIWEENNSAEQTPMLRVMVYNGDDTSPAWTYADGGGPTGILALRTLPPPYSWDVEYSSLLPFNGKLYAVWTEDYAVRIAVYSGNDSAPSWSMIDSGGLTTEGYNPFLTTLGSRLYVIWYDATGNNNEVRVYVYNGNDAAPSWAAVDGGSGINFNLTKSSYDPRFIAFHGKLYAIWDEQSSSGYAVHVAVGR